MADLSAMESKWRASQLAADWLEWSKEHPIMSKFTTTLDEWTRLQTETRAAVDALQRDRFPMDGFERGEKEVKGEHGAEVVPDSVAPTIKHEPVTGDRVERVNKMVRDLGPKREALWTDFANLEALFDPTPPWLDKPQDHPINVANFLKVVGVKRKRDERHNQYADPTRKMSEAEKKVLHAKADAYAAREAEMTKDPTAEAEVRSHKLSKRALQDADTSQPHLDSWDPTDTSNHTQGESNVSRSESKKRKKG